MILIFGGVHRAKLDYAKKNFEIETVCDCSDRMQHLTLQQMRLTGSMDL